MQEKNVTRVEEARNYLIRLCLELAELGFDEILLEYAGYPYFGETHVLATDELRPEDLSGPVEQFWRELKAVLSEQNVRLSMFVTDEMARGTEPYSGITPDLLSEYADRVWTTALPEDSDLADRLVLVGRAADGGSWAQIDPTVN